MSDSIIERGVPIPPKKEVSLAEKFPEFLALEVGDSFVISVDKFKATCFIEIANYGSRNGQRHEVRELDNKDYRVWRTR
jgi:hypothetical protein